jgi:hypothetical protein
MRKKDIVKKYFRSNPETLDTIKNEINRILENDTHIKDEDIPDFGQFLTRNNTIAQYYESNKQNNLYVKKSKQWYKRKIILIPVAISIFLFFFVLTSLGNALAENIYRTIVQWFGDSVNIQYSDSITPGNYLTTPPEYYDSLDEIESTFNIKAARNNEASINGQIEVERITDSYYVIKTNYLLDSYVINVKQTIYGYDFASDSTIQYGNNAKVVDLTLDDGSQYIGYVNNGIGYAIAYIDRMSIEIYADTIDYDTFTEFIRGLEIQ